MSNLSTELVALLRYLLPGFLAAWVFYGFTAHEKSSQFERVVQAVIFTLIVQSIFAILSLTELVPTSKNPTSAQDFLSVLVALFVGSTFALFANKDWLHIILRKTKLTKQTSYPSEWYGAFNNMNSYIVLHLKDGRRLYGWPAEWPQTHEKGHFLLISVSWLADEGKEHYLLDSGVEGILMPSEEVRWVEFMKSTEQ